MIPGDVCDVISFLDLSDDVTMTFRFCSSNTIRVRQTDKKRKKGREREGPGSRN